MNPPRFEEAIRAAARELAAVPGVRSAVLFGSAARGSATEESDIDIFIECNADAEDPAWKVLLALDRRFDVEFSVIYYRPEERGPRIAGFRRSSSGTRWCFWMWTLFLAAHASMRW